MGHTTVRNLILASALALAFAVVSPPAARADYFNYPCNYPFIGMGADVNVIVDAGGQFCDGPMEINGSHYHCESGGATVNLGVIGLAPISGVSVGGFGGSGVGGSGGSCTWRCPDNTPAARAPNPPAAWIKPLKVDEKNNDCRDHMIPNGSWSAPQGATPEGLPPGAPPPPDLSLPPPSPDDEGSIIQPGSPMPLP